jgi:hypothetical protein
MMMNRLIKELDLLDFYELISNISLMKKGDLMENIIMEL